MKKLILFAAIALMSNITTKAQLTQGLKKVLELKMPKTVDDDMPGTRGACVVWHPLQKKYYAAMAGNQDYPLAVFDAKGLRLSDDELTARNDTRGLWYNPATKLINGNTYADNGWFSYTLDSKGIPESSKIILEGSNQPGEQCVGSFNPVRKEVMFLKGSSVFLHDVTNGTSDKWVDINWGRSAKAGKADTLTTETPEAYNYTSVIYTGIPGAELGLLNTEKRQVELYNLQTGFLSKEIKLPADVPAEPAFNFAFTNGIYWFFNMETRTWLGYK